MDIRNLRFPANYFDLIIDKSTIDAILCGDQAFMNVALMLRVRFFLLKFNDSYCFSVGVPACIERGRSIHGNIVRYS